MHDTAIFAPRFTTTVLKSKKNASLAQLVEQLTCNQ
jgi:hypothetical protein